MKILLSSLMFLASSALFAGPAVDSARIAKTTRILGAHVDQEGSVTIAATPALAKDLATSLGLAEMPHDKLVVFAGQAAVRLNDAMASAHLNVTAQGTGDYRLLVFADGAADEALKVIAHVYGPSYRNAGELIVIKGAIDELVEAFVDVMSGALNLGVDVLKLTAHFICCSLDCIEKAALWLLNHAGDLIVKTIDGVLVLAKFTVGCICDVIKWVADNTWTLAQGAVQCAWDFVGGVWNVVTNILGTIWSWIDPCAFQVQI